MTISGKGGEFIFTVAGDVMVTDGYHTMAELYEHRIALWIALCRAKDAWDSENNLYRSRSAYSVWRSRLHSDGTGFDGWFILGMSESFGQLSYHLPDSKWDECAFAETLERAPAYDGHTSQDVLKRLAKLWPAKVPV